MLFEEFVDKIRAGVVSGVFTVKDAINYLTERGWHTTRNVPEEQREIMLKDLTK